MKINAVVRIHKNNGKVITHTYLANEFDAIYCCVSSLCSQLSKEDAHEVAASAASWCENAGIGETCDILDGVAEIEITEGGI